MLVGTEVGKLLKASSDGSSTEMADVEHRVDAVEFAPDGNKVAVCASDGAVRVYALEEDG